MLQRDHGDDQQRHGEKRAGRAPQPGPEDQRQEHGERHQRQLPAHDAGRDEVAFQRGEGEVSERRDRRMRQRRERHQADGEQHHLHDQRADIGNEIEQESQHAPGGRVRQADGEGDDGRRHADGEIDHGDDAEIGGQAVLHRIHDPECAQAAFVIVELRHHGAAQPRAAEQKEEQGAEEDQDLADRRRHEGQRRRYEIDDVDAEAGFFIVRQNGVAQVLHRLQRPVQKLEFLLDCGADFRRLADPVEGGGGEQRDHAVEDDDHQQPQRDRRHQRRQTGGFGARLQRPEHQADDEGAGRWQEQRPRQFERGDQSDEEDAAGRDLRGERPCGRVVGGRLIVGRHRDAVLRALIHDLANIHESTSV